MSIFSQFFSHLFDRDYQQKRELFIELEECEVEVFGIVVAYLHTGILVVPAQSCYLLFKSIALLANYFSLARLVDICEQELSQMVTSGNYKDILSFSG